MAFMFDWIESVSPSKAAMLPASIHHFRQRHFQYGFLLGMAEIGQLLRQFCFFIGQKLHGKQGGTGGTGFADGKRGHGHAFGHLHDG